MTNRLILATDEGVMVAERNGKAWQEIRRGLENQEVTSIIAREGVILVGTRQGVFRSDELGETWRSASAGLHTPYVRWLAYHPDISDFEFAGTEPANIYYSRDGAETWQICPEVTDLRERYGWRLPYSPAAGCVRGFAFHDQRAYAAVEDGCVLVSHNSGVQWQVADGSSGGANHRPAPTMIHSDVHSVSVHPFSEDLVIAPTGGGLYSSIDGGRTWTRLHPEYCRAVWVDPMNPDHMILGPAEGVDTNGRIEESRDGGLHWQEAGEGLETSWAETMVERFETVNDDLLAVLSNGELWSAALEDLAWRRILKDAPRVNAVTGM